MLTKVLGHFEVDVLKIFLFYFLASHFSESPSVIVLVKDLFDTIVPHKYPTISFFLPNIYMEYVYKHIDAREEISHYL
jgi:hypothetical protein